MTEIHDFLFQLMIILLCARVCAELAMRLKIPSVIGEITAGIILGPSLLGIVELNQVIKLLGEIGIILLLFEVGLQTDGSRLLQAGIRSIITAFGGFILPFVFGFGVSYFLLDYSIIVSLFVGGALTATSIGITIRVLEALGKQQQMVGQVVLGAAVIDDVLGVILLGVLFESTMSNQLDFGNATWIAAFIGVFFVVAPITAKLISFVIRYFDHSSILPGLIPTTVMSLVLLFAWLAQTIGAPELLGGFAAGLALSRRFFLPLGLAIKNDEEFADRIFLQMKPVMQLFTPIFFVVVGLSVNLKEIDWGSLIVWSSALVLFIAAVFGKMIGAYLVKASHHEKIATGLAMIPRGEVGLIFIELGRATNILDNQTYVTLLIVIVLTTIIPPFVLNWYYQKFEKYFS